MVKCIQLWRLKHTERTGKHDSPMRRKQNADNHEVSSPLQYKEYRKMSPNCRTWVNHEVSSPLQHKEHRDMSPPLQNRIPLKWHHRFSAVIDQDIHDFLIPDNPRPGRFYIKLYKEIYRYQVVQWLVALTTPLVRRSLTLNYLALKKSQVNYTFIFESNVRDQGNSVVGIFVIAGWLLPTFEFKKWSSSPPPRLIASEYAIGMDLLFPYLPL